MAFVTWVKIIYFCLVEQVEFGRGLPWGIFLSDNGKDNNELCILCANRMYIHKFSFACINLSWNSDSLYRSSRLSLGGLSDVVLATLRPSVY